MANSQRQDLETSSVVEIEIGRGIGETRGVIGGEFRGEMAVRLEARLYVSGSARLRA